jgi:tripartite-type tricarboxylate transporter receptor subunit TctC
MLKLPRRQFLHLAAGAAALPAVPCIARAQTYPSRPVRLVVGFPAGGTNDIHARLIADWLSKQFARSFIVENRPGAAGNIGLESVVRAARDGYTLSVCGSTELRNEILYTDLKFSFMHDTVPVASIMLAMNVLVVHPAFSVKSVPELIAAAKANPDAMTVGSAGVDVQHARARHAPEQFPPITSSASASSLSGTFRPRAFAVLRLMTSSNLVGRMTGRSAGLAPLRIRPV